MVVALDSRYEVFAAVAGALIVPIAPQLIHLDELALAVEES
jgi:hypothetical protein